MARVQETWVGVTPIRVPCLDCGRLVPAGSRICAECVRFDAELEARHARLREQFSGRLLGDPGRLLGHREQRLEREWSSLPRPGDAGRKSRLLAGLPRLDAGVEATEVCEASDFPTILAAGSWREALLGVGLIVGVLGVGCGLGTLLLLGARDAVARLIEWSA